MQIRSVLASLVALVACAAAPPQPVASPAAQPAACTGPAAMAQGPFRIDGPAAKLLAASGARLVDVRGPAFYAGGHIEGAINIPWAQMPERFAEVGPKDTKVIVYCRTGAGSAKAAATLVKLGYLHVYDLGSYLNWGEGAPPATPLP